MGFGVLGGCFRFRLAFCVGCCLVVWVGFVLWWVGLCRGCVWLGWWFGLICAVVLWVLFDCALGYLLFCGLDWFGWVVGDGLVLGWFGV